MPAAGQQADFGGMAVASADSQGLPLRPVCLPQVWRGHLIGTVDLRGLEMG